MALDTHGSFDSRRPGRRDRFAECTNAGLGQTRDLRNARRGKLRDARQELIKADCMAIDEVAVFGAHLQDNVHQPESKRGVGARPYRNMFISILGRSRANRVDHDDPRAIASRLVQPRSEVLICGQRIGAPQKNEARMNDAFKVHPHTVVADRIARGEISCDRADGDDVLRRTQAVPEPPATTVETLKDTKAADTKIWPDCLWAVQIDVPF